MEYRTAKPKRSCSHSQLKSEARGVYDDTKVYNTRPYLKQCVESVLCQTYSNFEYIIVDNGCTDGSSELLAAYAEQDPRICLIRYAINWSGNSQKELQDHATGSLLARLDSDDWWEPDYLERLITFIEKNNLDLAMTGTINYLEEACCHRILRQLNKPVCLTQSQFAQQYSLYWVFPSTVWGSIMRLDLYLQTDFSVVGYYPYGSDTMMMIEYIKQCSRIGIDNSALYHYRIHPKSVSYQYTPRRFDANIAYYEQIKGFLELHHTFDHPKQEWLKRVHLASMLATLQLLSNAKVPGDEKVAECARIAAHPLTVTALTNNCDERKQWYALMRGIVFYELSANTLSDAESLRTVLKTLSPHCYGAVQPENLGLFAREPSLRDALQKDDQSQLAEFIMNLIAEKRYIKQHDLGKMLCGLIPSGSPLSGISDARFFREYAQACMLMLQGNYSAALDQMTGVLFEKKKLYGGEQLLNLYLSLAALENHAPAFLFGKLRLAQLYLRQNRLKECRTAIDELAEMGLDNSELADLRQQLEGAQ